MMNCLSRRRTRAPFFSFLLFVLFPLFSGVISARAGEPVPAASLPPELRREEVGQRGLDEIQEMPLREVPCPVCAFAVSVPQVDSLMLKRRGASEGALEWRMDAERRDSDFCPYPGPGKVYWQADVVICPSCGYAAGADVFPEPVSEEAAGWVVANLRPALREAQAELLGWRRDEMTEAEVATFFNRQSEIPDPVRLEHWATFLAGVHAPLLERARACWLSAWAFRRRLADAPKSEVFARHVGPLRGELAQAADGAGSGVHGEAEALRSLLRRKRRGESGLPGAVDMTGRLLLAGVLDRYGFLEESEELLRGLHEECRERFLRPEQDPLWTETSGRASVTHRLNELELLRTDAEMEVLMCLELVRGERGRLLAAANHIREAIEAGEFAGRPAEVLVYSYLVGEFLRRGGNLPLAAEWLKFLLSVGGADGPLGELAAAQLECVGEEAGDRVNLLSALGRDGGLFALVREICRVPEKEAEVESGGSAGAVAGDVSP